MMRFASCVGLCYTQHMLLCLIVLILGNQVSPAGGNTGYRSLYDHSMEDNLALKVHTYATMVDPVGIAVGEYLDVQGLFVSSYQMNAISFISLQHDGHTKQMEAETISGGLYNIDSDGDINTASYAEPTRLSYDKECKMLFIACNRNKVIRVLNFRDSSVSTLQTDQNDVVTFGSSGLYQLSLPGFDIRSVAGDSLYVTDMTQLHRVVSTSHESYCDSIASSAALITYHSLAYYMQLHEYPTNTRISSVVPVEDGNMLYVAISDGMNVILKVPTSAVYSNQHADISRLVGNAGLSWSGLTNTQYPPVATNGYAMEGAVTLAFPMHMQLSGDGRTLWWTECFPYAGEFLLGSLAVRRIDIDSGWVDFYAGRDFSQDTETYRYLGTEGGYINAEASSASFRYPVSLAYYNDDVQVSRDSHGSLYVVDRWNNAIRRVAVVVDTAAPTSQYWNADPSSAPSKFPTQRPTVSAEPTSTYRPTKAPSTQPSISIAPTSHPSKRPTRRPTMKPSTLAPTNSGVWIQDNSIFSNLGLGTVHVGVGLYMLSILVGVVMSGLIVLAYIQRHVSPQQQLRTTEDIHDYESTREYAERKVRAAATRVVYWMGVCIPGSAFHNHSRGHDLGQDMSAPGQGDDSREGGFGGFWGGVAGWFSFGRNRGVPRDDPDEDVAEQSRSMHSMLQSVRDISSEQMRRNTAQPSHTSYTHTTMSPQEYRELTPREQEDGSYELSGSSHSRSHDVDLDDSSRSTTPMIVRTFGSSYDGL